MTSNANVYFDTGVKVDGPQALQEGTIQLILKIFASRLQAGRRRKEEEECGV